MYRHAVMLMVCGLVAASGEAAAQTQEWTDRGYANFNFGFGGRTNDLDAIQDFTLYAETARISVEGDIDAGAFFDLSGGARVWRNVSVGLAFSRTSSDGDAAIQGSAPHPVFFDRPRQFTTEVRGLERSESATHLSVGYMFVIDDKLDVLAYAGPSFFRVSQEVVETVQIAEAGAPFATVIPNPVIATRKESPVGGHIGADVTYRLYETERVKIGAGAFMRYSGASADIEVLDDIVASDVGGFQIGFGLRTRF
ncbi:MAG: hypothetical protein ABR606_10820 [Vicinamibacterales bacterium]